jgi:peptidoglycan/xylan/chitin deacetylase (PgdA/CDA1 family)
MYHYIREYDATRPAFNFLHVENFAKQVELFKSAYKFFDCANPAEYFAPFDHPDQRIYLTFDDGLSCQHDNAFRVLKENGLNGIFYVPAGPYLNGKILGVHKIHLILGTFGGVKACSLLDKYLQQEMIDAELVPEFARMTYNRQANSNSVNRFKRTLNHYINFQFRDQIIDQIFVELFGQQEENIRKEFYISELNLKRMASEGMVIGSHTVSHRLMSKLSEREFRMEIDQSLEYVDQFSSFRTFCYPYGGRHSYTPAIEAYLTKCGVRFSMDVNGVDITEDHIQFAPQTLPRYDCNQFPNGNIEETPEAISPPCGLN